MLADHLTSERRQAELREEEALPTTSSRPSEVPEKQEALFRDVLTLLENERIPFAVSGAFALRHHTGICRFTKDLDLFLPASHVAPALKHLEKHGFECEVRDPVWLAKAHKGEFFVDLISGMSNGVLMVEESWIERAIPAVVYGVKTRVLAPEELVASKIFVARRERFDGADIAHVIFGTKGSFDWKREFELMDEHWEMLLWSLVLFRYVYPAQSHFVPEWVWKDLLGKFEDAVARKEPGARFRGSIVDQNMFAIDVNEWEMDNILEETRQQRLAEIATMNSGGGAGMGVRKNKKRTVSR